MNTRTFTTAPGDAAPVAPPDLAQGVLDLLPGAVFVVDLRQHIRYRNRAARLWLADAPDLGEALASARFVGRSDGWQALLEDVLHQGGPVTVECMVPCADGRTAPSLVTLRCARLGPAHCGGAPCIVMQLDERPHGGGDEERIAANERLASIGRLVARVAHELNNPLDGILRYINLASRVAGSVEAPKLCTYLDESRTGLLRMVQIISELLEFSRSTQGEFDNACVNDIVEQSIRAVSEKAADGSVMVAADFQTAHMPSMRAGRLRQVLCNLMNNAIDAMPDGGRLTVTTALVGDEVVIRVADTGVGLPDEVEKVFEPFYTTKQPGKGTGLGLAICRDFVAELEGTLTAGPGDEGGAVFTVRIPTRSCDRSGDHERPAPPGQAGAPAQREAKNDE